MKKVFISFKNSVNGIVTEDASRAMALYNALTVAGVSCFFSNTSLKENGADKYMEIIQEELVNAKAIIVVCGNIEYVNTGWVKQEWMTYLNLCVSDPTRSIYSHILPSFGGTNNLPAFLRPYQSFQSIEETVSFVKNSLNHNVGDEKRQKTTFDFWDRFYGIYSGCDEKEALQYAKDLEMNEPIIDVLEAVHYLHVQKNDVAIKYLEKAMDMHCVSAFYVFANYLIVNRISLRKAKAALSRGYLYFEESRQEGAKLALVACTHKDSLNRVFYCAQILQNILLAANIACDILLLKDNCDLSNYKYVVYLLADEAEKERQTVLDAIFASAGKCMLMLNNFMEGALPKAMRNYTIYGCGDEEFDKIARYLIGRFGD